VVVVQRNRADVLCWYEFDPEDWRCSLEDFRRQNNAFGKRLDVHQRSLLVCWSSFGQESLPGFLCVRSLLFHEPQSAVPLKFLGIVVVPRRLGQHFGLLGLDVLVRERRDLDSIVIVLHLSNGNLIRQKSHEERMHTGASLLGDENTPV
jgi:hypothetical protein